MTLFEWLITIVFAGPIILLGWGLVIALIVDLLRGGW